MLNLGQEKEMRECIGIIDSFMQQVVDERKITLSSTNDSKNEKPGHRFKDLLSQFMKHGAKQKLVLTVSECFGSCLIGVVYNIIIG